jgi:hypothetical protein
VLFLLFLDMENVVIGVIFEYMKMAGKKQWSQVVEEAEAKIIRRRIQWCRCIKTNCLFLPIWSEKQNRPLIVGMNWVLLQKMPSNCNIPKSDRYLA